MLVYQRVLKMDHRRHCQDISRSFQIPDLKTFLTLAHAKPPTKTWKTPKVAYTGTYCISQHHSQCHSLLKKSEQFLDIPSGELT